jgi:hypothetical protein
VGEAREAILEDRYLEFKRDFYRGYFGDPRGRVADGEGKGRPKPGGESR